MNSRAEMFPSRLDALERVVGFLEAFCREAQIEREQCLRMNLVLEELFTNTVKHGHRGDCDAPVWVQLRCESSALRLTYEDTAPPFNPYARVETDFEATPLEERKVGGLGVFITREMAAAFEYAYLFGRNRVDLSLPA